MLTHHNWWSAHYECFAALCQKCGSSAGSTTILTNREVRNPLRKKTVLSGGKTEKNLSQFFLRLANTYKKYILQKKWVKTVIPALSSGRSNLQRPIWGCHRQLDDRDHLVGQLTTCSSESKGIWTMIPWTEGSSFRFLKYVYLIYQFDQHALLWMENCEIN